MERIKHISLEHQDKGCDEWKKNGKEHNLSSLGDWKYGMGMYQIYSVISEFFSPMEDWEKELCEEKEVN